MMSIGKLEDDCENDEGEERGDGFDGGGEEGRRRRRRGGEEWRKWLHSE